MQMLANFRKHCHTRTHTHRASCETTLPPAHGLRRKYEHRQNSRLTPRVCSCPAFHSHLYGVLRYVWLFSLQRGKATSFPFPFKIRSSDVLLLYLPALETGSVTVALFQLPSRRAPDAPRLHPACRHFSRNTLFVGSVLRVRRFQIEKRAGPRGRAVVHLRQNIPPPGTLFKYLTKAAQCN